MISSPIMNNESFKENISANNKNKFSISANLQSFFGRLGKHPIGELQNQSHIFCSQMLEIVDSSFDAAFWLQQFQSPSVLPFGLIQDNEFIVFAHFLENFLGLDQVAMVETKEGGHQSIVGL